MSNIPAARQILRALLDHGVGVRAHIEIQKAMRLMKRTPAQFRAQQKFHKLTREQVTEAKKLRRTGMHVSEIADMLHTNPGRVSEAL